MSPGLQEHFICSNSRKHLRFSVENKIFAEPLIPLHTTEIVSSKELSSSFVFVYKYTITQYHLPKPIFP